MLGISLRTMLGGDDGEELSVADGRFDRFKLGEFVSSVGLAVVSGSSVLALLAPGVAIIYA